MTRKGRLSGWSWTGAVLLCALAAAIVYHAWPRPFARITAFHPQGETAADGSIGVVFNLPMVPAAKVGSALPPGAARIDPPLPGRFVWADRQRLRFAAEAPLCGATAYQVRLAPDLHAAHRLAAEAVFHFHTPPLRLGEVRQLHLTPDRQLQFVCEFNHPVNPTDLALKLTVRDADGRLVDCRVAEQLPGRALVARTSPLATRQVTVSIGRGLRATGGALALERTAVRDLAIDLGLKIGAVHVARHGDGFAVRVDTTQPVNPAALTGFLEITPAVDWRPGETGGGFVLTGDFAPGRTYRIRCREGLPAVGAAPLPSATEREVTMPDLEPLIRLPRTGIYAPDQARAAFETLNVPHLRLRLRRVLPENVAYLLYGLGVYSPPRNQGPAVGSVDQDQAASPNAFLAGTADLVALRGAAAGGLFMLTVEDRDSLRREARQLLALTDLGIAVRALDGRLAAWVTHRTTGAPVAGATVQLCGPLGIEARAKADEYGLAELPLPAAADNRWTLVASRENDATFHELDPAELGRARLPAPGPATNLWVGARACQPGDTLDVHAVSVATETGVDLALERLDGAVLIRRPGWLSPRGSATIRLQVPAALPLGDYRLCLRRADETVLASAPLRVRGPHVAPVALRLEGLPDRRLRGGEELHLRVVADSPLGAPLAGRQVAVTCRFLAAEYRDPEWTDYSFGTPDKAFTERRLELGTATLDADDTASFALLVPDYLRSSTAIRVLVTASLDGDAAAITTVERAVDVRPLYVGLRRLRQGFGAPGQAESVAWVVVNPHGPLPAELAVSVRAGRTGGDNPVPLLAPTDGTFRRGIATLVPAAPGTYSWQIAVGPDGPATELSFTVAADADTPWVAAADRQLVLTPEPGPNGAPRRLLLQAPATGWALLSLGRGVARTTRAFNLDRRTRLLDLPAVDATDGWTCHALFVPGGGGAALAADLITAPAKRPELNVQLAPPRPAVPGQHQRLLCRVRDAAGNAVAADVAVRLVAGDPATADTSTWVGGVTTDPITGEAALPLVLPEAGRDFWLQARASDGTAVGAVVVPIALPPGIEAALPAPDTLFCGDRATVPLVLRNPGAAAVTVTVRASAETRLEYLGEAEQTVTLPPGARRRLYLPVVAATTAGPGSLVVDVGGPAGDWRRYRAALLVRNPTRRQRLVGSGTVATGDRARLILPGGWLPATADYGLTMSATPVLALSPRLETLARVPAPDLDTSLATAFLAGKLPELVSPAVTTLADGVGTRLRLCQLGSGGFARRPGDPVLAPAATVHAAHFLLDRHDPDALVLRRASLDYLADALLPSDATPLDVKAYAAWVLAIAGRPDRPWLRELYERRPELDAAGAVHLARALYTIGEQHLAAGLLPRPGSFEALDTATVALACLAFAEQQPGNPAGSRLRDLLTGRLADPMAPWTAALVAMAVDRPDPMQPSRYRALALLDGRMLYNFTQADTLRLRPAAASLPTRNGHEVQVQAHGTGQLYYAWRAAGVPLGGSPLNLSRRLEVVQHLRRPDGTEFTAAGPRHGDLVVAELEVRISEAVGEFTVEVPLAAGCRFENPAVAPALPPVAGEPLRPVEVLTTAGSLVLAADAREPGIRYYRYLFRAGTPGTYTAPPIRITGADATLEQTSPLLAIQP